MKSFIYICVIHLICVSNDGMRKPESARRKQKISRSTNVQFDLHVCCAHSLIGFFLQNLEPLASFFGCKTDL